MEQTEGAILQRLVEIDQDVAARDELRFGKYAIGRQTMIGKRNLFFQ